MLNLKVTIRWFLSVTLSLVMCYLISNAFYLKLALLCKNLFALTSHNVLFWHFIHKLTQTKLKWFWSALFFMFYVFLNSLLKVQPAIYIHVTMLFGKKVYFYWLNPKMKDILNIFLVSKNSKILKCNKTQVESVQLGKTLDLNLFFRLIR